MTTRLEWTTDADVHVDALTFASVAPGSPSAWQDLRLWNDRTALGADTARAVRVSALAKPRGASVPYEASGVPVLNWRAIEVDVAAQGIRSLGVAAEISIPDIPAESFIAVRVRVKAPAGFSLDAADVLLRLADDPYEDLGSAAPSPGGLDLGFPLTQIFEGGLVEPTGPTSDAVTVAAGAGQFVGRLSAWPETEVTLGSLDGAAEALTAGQAYPALIVVDTDGPRVVKGLRVTSPPPSDSYPATPAGAYALAKAVQRFGEDVESADLTDLRVLGGFAVSAPGGLGLLVGPGASIVGTRRVRADIATSFTAEASVTDQILGLDEQRQVVSFDGVPPYPTEPLARYSTDGSAVTSYFDLRRVAGPWRVGSAALPGLVAGEIAPILSALGGVEICPIRGVVVSVGDDPATLANTSVDWVVEIEAFLAGAWTSIYPDGPPTIAFDAALPWVAPPPQSIAFEAPMLRARVVSVPTGGDLAPIAVSVLYRVACVG
jgi:hypothetical protein